MPLCRSLPELSVSEYEHRKRAELALLMEYAAGESLLKADAVSAFTQHKVRLRARILAAQVEKMWALTETRWLDEGSLAEREIDIGNHLRATFRYQRGDMQWTAEDPLRSLYRAKMPDHARSVGFLLTSGMSAVAAVLASLDAVFPPGTLIELSKNTYFESIYFLRTWCTRLVGVSATGSATPAICYLDSIGKTSDVSAFARRESPPPRVAVLDTTCYSSESERVARFVARCLEQDVIGILVRSHLKLDCLGIEYGRLGSIVLVHRSATHRRTIEQLKSVIASIADWVLRTGTNFFPLTVPPFWSDERFQQLNTRRNHEIRKNQDTVVTTLHKRRIRRRFRFLRYHHGCFFTAMATSGMNDVEAELYSLQAQFFDRNLSSAICPSFGFDVLTIDAYKDAGGEQVIRVSVPDFDAGRVALTIDALESWADQKSGGAP